jgi:hypothetical protein
MQALISAGVPSQTGPIELQVLIAGTSTQHCSGLPPELLDAPVSCPSQGSTGTSSQFGGGSTQTWLGAQTTSPHWTVGQSSDPVVAVVSPDSEPVAAPVPEAVVELVTAPVPDPGSALVSEPASEPVAMPVPVPVVVPAVALVSVDPVPVDLSWQAGPATSATSKTRDG